MSTRSVPQQLSTVFGDYRAEWSGEAFASLFVVPPYFSKLETNRPCFLIGGRARTPAHRSTTASAR